MTRPESTTVRREPAVEDWTALGDLQPLQKIAVEQLRQRAHSLWRERSDSLLGRASDLDGVDPAIGQVELDALARGEDAPVTRLVDDASDLAQAPTQLATR